MSAAVTMPAPRERPMIFSAPMIGALLAGTKRQTRRIVSPFEDASPATGLLRQVHSPHLDDDGIWRWMRGDPKPVNFSTDERRCPYGAVGDRLWVKETWALLTGNGHRIVYRADGVPMTKG